MDKQYKRDYNFLVHWHSTIIICFFAAQTTIKFLLMFITIMIMIMSFFACSGYWLLIKPGESVIRTTVVAVIIRCFASFSIAPWPLMLLLIFFYSLFILLLVSVKCINGLYWLTKYSLTTLKLGDLVLALNVNDTCQCHRCGFFFWIYIFDFSRKLSFSRCCRCFRWTKNNVKSSLNIFQALPCKEIMSIIFGIFSNRYFRKL